jgi:hypothetical protein
VCGGGVGDFKEIRVSVVCGRTADKSFEETCCRSKSGTWELVGRSASWRDITSGEPDVLAKLLFLEGPVSPSLVLTGSTAGLELQLDVSRWTELTVAVCRHGQLGFVLAYSPMFATASPGQPPAFEAAGGPSLLPPNGLGDLDGLFHLSQVSMLSASGPSYPDLESLIALTVQVP